MDKNLLEEIKLRLDTNRYELRKLDEFYLKAFAPKGYKGSTSYNDYDTIPSGNKEYSIEEFLIIRNRLIKAIEYDEKVLFKLVNEINLDAYLELLEDNKEKIEYLRNVQGYSINKISEKLDISRRHINRVLKKENEEHIKGVK